MDDWWDPDDWEKFVFGLLQDRHGSVNVMKVPARHKGDFGIDYYCLSERVVYQCYAVQEPCTVPDRADKQKAKITADLKKFSTNSPQLNTLLNGCKISRWILLVPVHDSSYVNIHASVKTKQIKDLNLPYVDKDFEVLIQDFECFDELSRQQRLQAQRQFVLLSQPPSDVEIDEWWQEFVPLVDALGQKLKKRITLGGDEQINENIREVIGWFLEKENALDDLRDRAPQLHETLVAAVSRQSNKLSFAGPPAVGTPAQILGDELAALESELIESVPNISRDSAHKFAIGSIAEWLLRCPLDFPPYNHAS